MPDSTNLNEQFDKESFDKIWLEYEKSIEEPLEQKQDEAGRETKELLPSLSEHLKEELEYMEGALKEYQRFVLNIGNLKYTAAMLLYHRDDVQDSMDYLKHHLDLKEHWKKIVDLDNILRANANVFVNEVGYNNFKQYQIINDPPKLHWWWYLNKQVAAPPSDKKWWQVWK